VRAFWNDNFGRLCCFVHKLPPGWAVGPLNPGIINTAMLQSCFAGGATNYPAPREWAKTATPFLLKINSADNGKQLTVQL
jgi:hypothetical protein